MLVVAAFFATRALALGATHLGARFMTGEKRAEWAWVAGRSDLHVVPPPAPALAPLVRWDAAFYLAIAKEGYPAPRAEPPVYHLGFFPLYPPRRARSRVALRQLLLGRVRGLQRLRAACGAVDAPLGRARGGAAAALLARLPFPRIPVFRGPVRLDARRRPCRGPLRTARSRRAGRRRGVGNAFARSRRRARAHGAVAAEHPELGGCGDRPVRDHRVHAVVCPALRRRAGVRAHPGAPRQATGSPSGRSRHCSPSTRTRTTTW